MNKEKNFISAVVYVNNNEKNIVKFLENLISVLKEKFLKYEIICVNDASTDNSVKVIKKVAKKNPDSIINIINMSFYQGQELAMNAGIDLTIGDFVYEFDSVEVDYDFNLIIDIYEKALDDGNDIVTAISKKKKRKSSMIFYTIFNKFSNNQYKIGTETFRILSRRAINRIHSINISIPYRKAIYANCGLKLSRVEYVPTNGCLTKLNIKIQKERRTNAMNALILFTDVGYKISIALSIIMMFITIGVGIYAISVFLMSKPVAGWTTTMLFLSFGFFAIFIMFVIIIKYLSIMINLIFRNSKYLIESIDKLN